MKNIFKILIFMLLCMGQTGCFFLSSASSGSKSSSTSSSSSSEYIYTSDQLLCSRRWELTYGEISTHYYKNGQFLSATTNEAKNYYRSQWIQFNSNHTCYESGLYGSNGQQKQKEEMREKERKVGDFIYFAILFHNMEATDLII